MTEIVRSFIVVFSLFSFTLWIIGKNLPFDLTPKEFRQWRNLLLLTVIAAFISSVKNIWMFYVAAVFLLSYFPQDRNSRTIYYLLLFCAVPLLPTEIPGFGGIRFIFEINYNRFLIIVLLLIPFLKQKLTPRLYSLPLDKYIVAFTTLLMLANFRDNTITNALRESLLIFLDIFIPYIILSRHLNSPEQLNRAFFALFTALLPLAIIGVFETAKGWHLYSALSNALIEREVTYDHRADLLRAGTIFSSPIVFGYTTVIGFGLLLYLKPMIKSTFNVKLAGIIFFTCLIATLARGPWVGFVMLILAYFWIGNAAVKHLMIGGITTAIAFPLLTFTETGNKFIQLLPFIGSTRADTIDYREQLIDMAWIVFQRRPLLGSPNFRDTPEMELMRQGQGIIDVVNSYINIVLSYGAIGLFLFLTIFFSLTFRCFKVIKRLPKDEIHLIRMGKALFAILLAVLIIIFTVSSIDYIPIFYWALAGITAGYLNTCNQVIKSKKVTNL